MKKIVSLVLAVLMVLSVVPMMFMTATAAAAGSKPATLPTVSGDYYVEQIQNGLSMNGTTMNKWYNDYVDDASRKITISDKYSWVNAEGFMFKFDTTNVSGTDPVKLAIQLAIYSNDGTINTYLVSDPNLAKAFGGVATDTANTSSTWYVCTDGSNWTSVTHKWQSGYAVTAPLTTERTTGYVFIPMDQFQSKGLSTDANKTMMNGTDTIAAMSVNGQPAKFQEIYVRAEGAATNANFVISEMGFVYSGTLGAKPTSLPTVNGAYTLEQIQNGFSFKGSDGGAGGKWYDNSASSPIKITDMTSWISAKGLMFKYDATGVAGADPIRLGIELSVTSANGSTYLIADPNLAKAHGGVAADTATTSSTWYVCNDGVNWIPVTHKWSSAYATTTTMTTKHLSGYVFIPWDQFQTKGFGDDKTMLTGDKAIEFLTANGAEAKFAGFKFRAEGAANNANFIVSEIGFVYVDEVVDADLAMPSTLPGSIDAFYAASFLRDGTVLTGSNCGYNGNGGTYDDGFIVDCRWGDADLSQGMIFKFDTSKYRGSGSLRMSFELYMNHLGYYVCSDPSMANARGGNVNPAATSTWYYTLDGKTWTETTATGAFPATIHNEKGVGYIFIPWTSFWAGSKAAGAVDANGYSLSAAQLFANQAAANTNQNMMGIFKLRTEGAGVDPRVTFSNFAIVYPSREMPSTLPNGDAFYTQDFLYGNPVVSGTVGYNGIDFINSDQISRTDWSGVETSAGMILKIDTSDYFGNAELLTSIEILINGSWLCSDLALAGARGAKFAAGDASVWYYSLDGKNWISADVGGNQYLAKLHSQAAYAYYFIPWESFWYTSKTVVGADGCALNGAELFAQLEGEKVTFNQMKVRTIGGHGTDSYTTLSDFAIVYPSVGMPSGDFAQSSVTITDSIAYNLYVNEPAGATDVAVLATVGGKTYRIGGVAKDGMTCYSISNILPQQVGETITIKWSGTVDGEKVTYVYTDSVLRYLNRVLASNDLAKWHDLANTMRYYAAAVQKYANGTADADLTRGATALLAPVTIANLPSTLVNRDSGVFKSYTLRLDSEIAIKIKVNAPAGVTMARYTVGTRSGVANIVDGYVLIPVYAYEMMDVVAVTLWNGTSDASATLTVSASAYIKNVYASTSDAKLKNVLQAIANYAQEANLVKGTRALPTLAETTLSQLKLAEDNGMCYVTQLADGRFIVIDGGNTGSENRETLWRFLVEKSGYAKPVIAVWMFTHQHGDHVDNAFYLLDKYADKMEVQSIAYSWATEEDFAARAGDTASETEYKTNNIAQLREKAAVFNKVLEKHSNATIWDMKAGDSKTFGEVKIDVLYTAKDWTCDNPWDQNYLSNMWKMTYTQGTTSTADDKTFLVVGDSQEDRFQALLDDYSSAVVNCDVLQATHHGSNGGYKAAYQAISPSVTFMPTPKSAHESGTWYNKDFNVYLRQNSAFYTHEVTVTISMKTLQKVN